jgi:Glycosyl transferase family 2
MKRPFFNTRIVFIITVFLILIIIYAVNYFFSKMKTPPSNVSVDNGAKTSIAFVSLMRNPIDLPLWLKYHRNLGIRRFFIRLEDSPSWEEYLKDMTDVVLEIGESDKNGNNYTSLIERQIKYVNSTLTRAKQMQDIEWLIHIDADELLHGDISKINVPDTIKTIKFENAEAIFDKKRKDTCFSATNFLRCGKDAPCKSYINGKPAGRIHDSSVTLAGPHDFAYNGKIEGEFQHKMPFEDLHILHFEGCTFGAWVEKFFHLSKQDKAEMPFQYYKESIETAKTAHELYEHNKMPSVNSFKSEHVYTLYQPIL